MPTAGDRTALGATRAGDRHGTGVPPGTAEGAPLEAAPSAAGVAAAVDGPAAGLALVEALATPALVARHTWHAVRAGLLEELGRTADARAAYEDAAARTENASEREHFAHKLEVVSSRAAGPVGNAARRSSSC